jgi:predicted ArsR family transcriptional regulator
MSAPDREPIDQVAALAEPVRRRLYDFVARRGDPVDRDEAAAAVGIGRPLAAFHLDRLVAAGLLDVVFRRRTGRTGPGAGRPAKFYVRPAERDVEVHLPPRHYDVAADLLAEGVEGDADARATVLAAARRRGAALATPADASAEGASPLLRLLDREGYEPFEDADGTIRLRNCPFHALADAHRELTCAMNFALLDGAEAELADPGYRAVPQPPEGLCCVAFERVSG